MNLEALKTFLRLAENGSFSKTAKELHVVQSTVSSRINELEREIGQQLFIRNHHASELTLAGKALVRYAEELIRLEAQAIDQVNLVGNFSDRLRIGTVYSFYDTHLCGLIAGFLERHPDTSLQVAFGHSGRMLSDLNQKLVEIAYVHHSFHHPDFVCSLLDEEDVVLVTGSQNSQYCGGIPAERIRELPVYDSNYLYETTRNWLFPRHQLFPLQLDIGVKIVPLLKGGKGYTFLPRKLIEEELAQGTLLEIPVLDKRIPKVQHYVVYRSGAEKASAVQKWLFHYRKVQLLANDPEADHLR